MIQQAEWISGIKLSEADRRSVARSVNQLLQGFEAVRAVKLENSVPLALAFDPAPWLPPAAPAAAPLSRPRRRRQSARRRATTWRSCR